MIIKDKKYKIVYLTTLIAYTIILIALIALFVFIIKRDFEKDGMYITFFVCFGITVGLVILGYVLGGRSLYGYLKLPDVLVDINGDSVIINTSKTNTVTVSKSDIKNVEVVKILLSRSTKALKIETENDAYYLKDILCINDACIKLRSECSL